ncbi:hypothetical protein M2404_001321 [Rheinheimera pacifica]|uniref:DUF3300 domain-containing protein n=1 Tax=Rheinheimera pacifica TaxID=173990 RepID=UPI002168FE29|nr:DUF3300 domain-containing protein [Rheinheimera pacifica]MCS4306996.1 hypothetical protein [Rheinheimera pacifica]
MKNLMLQLSRILAMCVLLVSQSFDVRAEEETLSQAQLDQMLAPIALYPDTVLTHVLIASTYPLEVVQAARWVKDNPKLTGEAAVDAVEKQSWDPSVKALVAFPQLLERLSNDLDWTQELGEAFLADEAQVMASIQTLRQKAYANGSLNDTKHVVVEREREIIIIEPARKEVVYVPVYDTRVVYGDWWWPSHPPVYWHTAGVYYRNSPFHWGVSVNVRPWFYFGIFDWHHRHVVVHHHYYHKPPRYYPVRHRHYVDARRWHHNTEHRRGVHYRHERLNRDYNSGYGYRQPTREIKGQPVRHTRVDSNATVRENKQHYQRKTAEQVKMPNREWQANDNNNQRQQRHVSTEQRQRPTEVNRDERRQQQLNQQLKEQRQPALQRERSERVISTEQLRQREVQTTQPQRTEQRQLRTEQRQPTVQQQPALQQRQPQVQQPRQQPAVQQRQPQVQQQAPAVRQQQVREPRQTATMQRQERPARQIQ